VFFWAQNKKEARLVVVYLAQRVSNGVPLCLRTGWPMSKCCWHGTLLHFSLQSFHLNICYYHQDLHWGLFHLVSRPTRLRHSCGFAVGWWWCVCVLCLLHNTPTPSSSPQQSLASNPHALLLISASSICTNGAVSVWMCANKVHLSAIHFQG